MKKQFRQYQVNTAYGILRRMMDRQLPLRVSYDLFRLAMATEQNYVFELKRESELVNRFGGVIDKEGGVRFGDDGKAQEFKNALAELNQLEVEIEIPEIVIELNEDMKITPEEVAGLNGFVTFIDN